MLEFILNFAFCGVFMAIPYIGTDKEERKKLRQKIKKYGKRALSPAERKAALKHELLFE